MEQGDEEVEGDESEDQLSEEYRGGALLRLMPILETSLLALVTLILSLRMIVSVEAILCVVVILLFPTVLLSALARSVSGITIKVIVVLIILLRLLPLLIAFLTLLAAILETTCPALPIGVGMLLVLLAVVPAGVCVLTLAVILSTKVLKHGLPVLFSREVVRFLQFFAAEDVIGGSDPFEFIFIGRLAVSSIRVVLLRKLVKPVLDLFTGRSFC